MQRARCSPFLILPYSLFCSTFSATFCEPKTRFSFDISCTLLFLLRFLRCFYSLSCLFFHRLSGLRNLLRDRTRSQSRRKPRKKSERKRRVSKRKKSDKNIFSRTFHDHGSLEYCSPLGYSVFHIRTKLFFVIYSAFFRSRNRKRTAYVLFKL